MTESEFSQLVDEESVSVIHFSHFADMGRGLIFPEDMKQAILNTKIWNLSCCALTPGRQMQPLGEVGILFHPKLSQVLSVSGIDAGASMLPDGSEFSGGNPPSRQSILASLNPGLEAYNEWRVHGAEVAGIFVSRVDYVTVKSHHIFNGPLGLDWTIAPSSIPLGVVFKAFSDFQLYAMDSSGLKQLAPPITPFVEVKPPFECSDEEIKGFCALVRSGGEVAQRGLEERVRAAALLTFLWSGRDLIGVAGLKCPLETHRAEVETKSGECLSKIEIPLELGWVYVHPKHQGGKSKMLCAALLERARSVGIFATSREDNLPMHNTLSKLGFRRIGGDWPSDLNQAKLLLFVLEPR